MVQLSGAAQLDNSTQFNSGALFIVKDITTTSGYSISPNSASTSHTTRASTSTTTWTTLPIWTTPTSTASTTQVSLLLSQLGSSLTLVQLTTSSNLGSSTFETMTSSFQSQTSSAVSISPSQTTPSTTRTNTNNGGSLSNAADVTTIVGSVVGVTAALMTLFLTWLAFRKDKNGNRALPQKLRTIRGSLSQHGSSHHGSSRHRTRR